MYSRQEGKHLPKSFRMVSERRSDVISDYCFHCKYDFAVTEESLTLVGAFQFKERAPLTLINFMGFVMRRRCSSKSHCSSRHASYAAAADARSALIVTPARENERRHTKRAFSA